MKTLVAMGLVVAASAASPEEEKLVHKIRSTPGVLWRAEVGALQGRSLKTLSGVNAESWGAVQKLPKEVAQGQLSLLGQASVRSR